MMEDSVYLFDARLVEYEGVGCTVAVRASQTLEHLHRALRRAFNYAAPPLAWATSTSSPAAPSRTCSTSATSGGSCSSCASASRRSPVPATRRYWSEAESRRPSTHTTKRTSGRGPGVVRSPRARVSCPDRRAGTRRCKPRRAGLAATTAHRSRSPLASTRARNSHR